MQKRMVSKNPFLDSMIKIVLSRRLLTYLDSPGAADAS